MLGKSFQSFTQEVPNAIGAASDLHANNIFLTIADEKGKRVFKSKFPNDPERILAVLHPHQKDLGHEG